MNCRLCEVEISGAAFELPRRSGAPKVVCKSCALVHVLDGVSKGFFNDKIKIEEARTAEGRENCARQLDADTSETIRQSSEGKFCENDSYPERSPRSGTGRETSAQDRRETTGANADDDADWKLRARAHKHCLDCNEDLDTDNWERFRYEEGSRCEPCKIIFDDLLFEHEVFGSEENPRPLAGIFNHYHESILRGDYSTAEAVLHVKQFILERDARLRT